MKEKIQNDIKEAMRGRDELRLSVLRMLFSAIHNRELEKRSKTGKAEELNEEEIVAVIRSETKKRRDAIGEFEKGGREDLAEKEADELKILEIYLPQEISDGEVEKIVGEIISGFGVVTSKDFGKIMGKVMQKIGSAASGDRVSGAVRKVLGA